MWMVFALLQRSVWYCEACLREEDLQEVCCKSNQQEDVLCGGECVRDEVFM